MNEILELIDEILSDEKLAVKTLRKINRDQKTLLTNIEQFQVRRREAMRHDFLEEEIDEKIIELKDSAKEVYAEEIKTALTSAPEFAFAGYVTGLLSIIEDDSWITITRSTRTGFSTSLLVNLNMNSVAGTTADWAAGVEAVRDDLAISGKDATKRSAYWAGNIYSTRGSANGPYAETISARIEASNKPAAFWELLDKGNVTVGLPSDIGGYATPKNKATRFVSNVERKIKSTFREWIKRKKVAFDKYIEELDNGIISMKDSYDELSFVLTEVETKFELIKDIANRYNRKYGDIDPRKVISAMNSAAEAYDRVDVAKKGAKRLRISAKYFFRS